MLSSCDLSNATETTAKTSLTETDVFSEATTASQETTTVTTTSATTTTPATTTTTTTTAIITEPPFVVEDVMIAGEMYSTDITEIDLSHKRLSDEDLNNLAKCKKLISLNLYRAESESFNMWSSPFDFISEMTELEILYLPMEADFDVVRSLKNLTFLKTTPMEMLYSDFDLSCLRGHDELRELYLPECHCSSIETLKDLKSLERLEIYEYTGSCINDSNIDVFTSMTNLKELYIGSGSDEYMQKLKEALSGCEVACWKS